jgi:hypothetical protein
LQANCGIAVLAKGKGQTHTEAIHMLVVMPATAGIQ